MVDKLPMQEASRLLGQFSLSQDWLTAGSVSAALLTQSGHVYSGICLDMACGIGFCAEHAAIADMLKARETVIESIVALRADGIVPPCGRCRELMLQVDRANRHTRVWLSESQAITLEGLLPESWMEL
ncbi:MAG: cytidine deaminase [Leptolyngbyaceae cyanobacterium]